MQMPAIQPAKELAAAEAEIQASRQNMAFVPRPQSTVGASILQLMDDRTPRRGKREKKIGDAQRQSCGTGFQVPDSWLTAVATPNISGGYGRTALYE